MNKNFENEINPEELLNIFGGLAYHSGSSSDSLSHLFNDNFEGSLEGPDSQMDLEEPGVSYDSHPGQESIDLFQELPDSNQFDSIDFASENESLFDLPDQSGTATDEVAMIRSERNEDFDTPSSLDSDSKSSSGKSSDRVNRGRPKNKISTDAETLKRYLVEKISKEFKNIEDSIDGKCLLSLLTSRF